MTIALLGPFATKKNEGIQPTSANRESGRSSLKVVKEFYELIDTQDISSYRELFSKDCEIYFGSAKHPKYFDDVIPFIKEHYKAFPDYRHIVQAMYADNDYVTVRVRYTGTHREDFFNHKASGNTIDYNGIFVFQVQENKIINVWAIEDNLGLYEQLKSTNKEQFDHEKYKY